jgi:phage-related protein
MALGFTTSASFGSRAILPDKGIGRHSTPRVLVAKFGDGYEQRLVDGINSVDEVFSVTFNNRTAAEIDDITGYFASLKGATSFTYTIPDSTQTSNVAPDTAGERRLKVVCQIYSQSYHHDGFYSVSATLKRVYEA